MERQPRDTTAAVRLRQKLAKILAAKWWIGVGVCVAAIGVYTQVCINGPVNGDDPEWLRVLRADVEELSDTPANRLLVSESEVLELVPTEHALFRSVALERNGTLVLTGGLSSWTLRSGTITLGQGATILAQGEAGRPGEHGTHGSKGTKCSDGSNGTPGLAGGAGDDGIGIQIEALELVVEDDTTIDTSGGAGGAGGDGGAGGNGGRGDRSERCHGGDGGNGGKGGPGGKGGNAGNLRISFGTARTTSGSELGTNNLTRRVAHVGSAGSGGAGGRGGGAGSGGRGRGSNVFFAAKAGSTGDRGQAGEPGADGNQGTRVGAPVHGNTT